MKLFLASNESTANSEKIKMLEVAVKSALKNTNFEVFVIFDGDKKTLRLPENVTIIEHRHRCYDVMANSKKCSNEIGGIQTASSTFLRTEIPFLLEKLNFTDEFVLYTDYDVVFLPGDYTDLESLKPSVFAAGPESSMSHWSYINAGVMVKNVDFFKKEDSFIIDYINNNFENLHIWDQTMYNNLYLKNLTKLPLEYNWKPYWGINENAKIIHFHGPKPFSIVPKENMTQIPILNNLYNRNPSAYGYYNQIFESFL